MVRNGFMGDPEGMGVLDGGFLQQKTCHPLVKALPHNLLDQPHHVGEAGGHQLVGVVGQRSGFLHNALIDFRRDDPQVGILLRFNDDVKLDRPHHAGGGEQADVPVKQPVNGDLPALVREDVRAELAGSDQKQPRAVRASVVEHSAPGDFFGSQAAQDPVLLKGG